MDASTILDRRTELEEELDRLGREQGAAWLDGKEFDAAQIDAAQASLDALDRAEAESTRREREVAHAAAIKDRAEARQEARRVAATQAAALVRIEESAKALAADIAVVGRSARTLAGLYRRVGLRRPVSVDQAGVFVPISRLLAGELSGLDSRCGLGDLSLPDVPKPDWRAFAATLENHLDPLVKGESE
jgi:hypothetical protein